MKRLLACVFLLAACSSTAAAPPPSSTGRYAGFGLVPPLPRPAFTLTDTSGARFSFQTVTRGHPTLLFFGYTYCPDVCPTTMADIRNALDAVPSALQERTYVVFVTTDVKRDTGPVLAAWLRHFVQGSKAHFVGLRGTQTQIDAAQAASHIFLATDDGQTHSAQVLLYGADDYARVNFVQADDESQQIAHDLELVATS